MPCAGAIASLVAGLVLAGSEPVVIGTEAPFPAYTYLAEDGTITGHDRDLMDDICARMVWRCEWQNVHFDELVPGVMSGRFDIIIGGIAGKHLWHRFGRGNRGQNRKLREHHAMGAGKHAAKAIDEYIMEMANVGGAQAKPQTAAALKETVEAVRR